MKDGSTIVGSVVGFEGNSFKVKTSYGYALVEKDKIVSIRISGSPAKPANGSETRTAERKSEAQLSAARSSKKPDAEANAQVKDIANKSSSSAPASTVVRPASSGIAAASNAASPAPAVAQSGSIGTPTNVSATPPEPQPIREQVTGNTYVNDTYQFQMYKPPDWQVMDGARSVLPGAVAAMGTGDQSTYLVVAREPMGKSAAADAAEMQKRLSDILVNFRPLRDEALTVSGAPAVAHRFRGSVDEHDWSGFMVFVPRGGKLYTIFGMTRADNDLVQIQENVIRRTIASFQFLPQ